MGRAGVTRAATDVVVETWEGGIQNQKCVQRRGSATRQGGHARGRSESDRFVERDASAGRTSAVM